MTGTSAPPRRSGRERKQVESVYTDAKKVVAAEMKAKKSSAAPRSKSSERGSRKRTPADENPDTDNEDEDQGTVTASEEEESSNSSGEEETEDEDADDDFEAAKSSARSKNPKTGAGAGARDYKRTAAPEKTKIQMGGKSKTSKKSVSSSKDAAAASSSKQGRINAALASLAKNILPPNEEPGLKSLIAGLLSSYRQPKSTQLTNFTSNVSLNVLSPYTINLHSLAERVIEMHNENPNRAQLALLNLLFRSVGGTKDSDLPMGGGGVTDVEEDEEEEEEETILEDMQSDDWAAVVTDLVDEMRHVPANQILLCADPLGAVHQEHAMKNHGDNSYDDDDVDEKKKGTKQYVLGAAEFRKIYKEFWYILGYVALTEGGMATNTQQDDDDDESPGNVVRLDAGLVKELIVRVIELAPVGQPDVRAGAILAAISMSHAVLDQSAQLVKKMDVASRQYQAAKKGKNSSKAEALKVRIDSLKRSAQDLEEVVLGNVIQGLFVHRYRDSNEHIRAMCIESLSRMTLQRPDIFLTDKYLKYFGWMMHDKDYHVRIAALNGLLQPFLAVQDATEGKKLAPEDEFLMIDKIELAALENVTAKFLPRITSSVKDLKPEVQEIAIKLMVMLLKGGFLDNVEDDEIWDQINECALSKNASPAARRDALYFILEQLEAFDDEGEGNESSERKRSKQLDSIASYAAHAMTNGPVPLDKIKIELADFLVQSLREMPEHRALVTDWSAMLRAIKDDNSATTAHNVRAGDRANVGKQRVLVRMLACAAQEEVGAVAEESFLNSDADPDLVSSAEKGKKASTGREHENLSVALLKALPNLLLQFKGDTDVISELACLPRFIVPTVFSLPQRKQDFLSLIKNLGDIYLSSSNEDTLDKTARSLVSLCKGNHARVTESKTQLRMIVNELRDRIVELMSSDDSTIATSALSIGPDDSEFASKSSKRRPGRKKSTKASPASSKTSLTDDDTRGSADVDTECSIFLNVKRLRILARRCDLSEFFGDKSNVNQLELLCNFICDGLKSRLRACKPVDLRINADEETAVDKLIEDPDVLAAIGQSVNEGLQLILVVIAWFFNSYQDEEGLVVNNKDLVDDMDDDDDHDDSSVDDHVILRLRNRLLSLLELCFSQYIPSADEHADDDTTVAKHSNDQIRFADYVQLAAGRTSSDLRVLFSKDFADAENPLLRAVALQDDGRLVGAYVRFVNAKEHLLRENEVASKENKMLAQSLLLPMGRAIANNWARGNRREAGVFLRHISSAGPTATAIVSSACDQMKKVDSVRMLESQMASLRQSYENWVDEEPDMENDKPSEEEMKDFEEAEKRHKEQFEYLEHRAAQFSKKLGVFGKLSDAKLRPALNGFIKEGIRFSFSNLDNNGEDSLVLGSRLSFLSILSKYASWIKRDKQAKKEIQKFIDEKEVEMKNHEEFDDVHEDDLGALATFRVTLGLKNIPKASSYGAEEDEEMGIDEASDGVNELQSPVASVSSRASKASRASSKASSRVSSLPALLEGDKESPQDSDEDSHFSAAGSSSDNKRKSQTQNTYEESDENDSDDSSLGLGYSQKSKVSQKSKASQKSKKARRSK